MKTIIKCVDCLKQLTGKDINGKEINCNVYVDKGKYRCEKCVEKLYKLEKKK